MPASSTKSRYSREIGLPAEAMEVVQRRLAEPREDGTLFGDGCRKASYAQAQQKALSKLNIKNYRFNVTLRDLRHTYGTLAVQAGTDLVAVMRSMGHKDLRTAERYQHSSLVRNASASAAVAKALTGTLKPAHPNNASCQESETTNDINNLDGGRRGFRTHDPRLVRPVLYP